MNKLEVSLVRLELIEQRIKKLEELAWVERNKITRFITPKVSSIKPISVIGHMPTILCNNCYIQIPEGSAYRNNLTNFDLCGACYNHFRIQGVKMLKNSFGFFELNDLKRETPCQCDRQI